jgi:hypothetical protein
VRPAGQAHNIGGEAAARATMEPPLTRAVALIRHPETRSDAVRGIRARVGRTADGILAVSYSLEGDVDRLRVPSPRTPRIAERLWQHTCCEIFVARKRSPAYHEFNFGPSGEWAAYAFVRYRDGGLLAEDELNPGITIRSTAATFELDARVPLGRLSPRHLDAGLVLGLSAIVEDESGTLSYWALRHPPGAPDFHHPDAFALELDEVRH